LILRLKAIHYMCVNDSNLLAVTLASQCEIKYVKMKLKIDSCVRGLQEHVDEKPGRSGCRREGTFMDIALQKYTSVKP